MTTVSPLSAAIHSPTIDALSAAVKDLGGDPLTAAWGGVVAVHIVPNSSFSLLSVMTHNKSQPVNTRPRIILASLLEIYLTGNLKKTLEVEG
ncbi:hypothetical protein M8994_13740 [Brucella sp. 21LCYQ03]|nr:hypothetical protein [Brucella sp. 21LCYQ03]